jgi:hypothetical protein
VIVLIGVVLILNRSRPIEPGRRDIVFLLVALVALLSLVQFPYGIPLYYCYVAPLVALAAVAVVSYGQQRDQWVVCALLAAFALYGAAYLDRAYFGTLSDRFVRDGHVETLDTSRASIRIVPSEAASTTKIVALLRRHARGSYTFAGPDMPHIYFLADLGNPTRSLFDFLDTTDSARGSTLLRTLREKRVSAIAVNSAPIHSDPLDSTTSRRLATMYPKHARVGAVDVRWRVP